MTLTTQMANHIRGVHFGGNSTAVNLKDTLKDVSWKEATTQVHSFNTIVKLVFHINYYISIVIPVFEGGPLEGKDIYSYEHPPIKSETDWSVMLEKMWDDAEKFANLVAQLPEAKLWEDFTDNKYGNYYKNIHGIIEHSFYHMGQIVIIKKLLRQMNEA